eukprot:CAMPEP_0172654050 /NCGR_PEP_ID=MMETSP1068-20121228/244132_1 /TAXON_ID=35684 /ORGANISM="Pseudopedinella elastica, Strain CCMP716" /LENGTH=208 /DNA_ID=CAMNT_0013468489 /DNA_START=1785 /DNA_END=2412 /DNA_ORIENTATION=-
MALQKEKIEVLEAVDEEKKSTASENKTTSSKRNRTSKAKGSLNWNKKSRKKQNSKSNKEECGCASGAASVRAAGDEIEEGGRELYFGKKVANHNFKAVAGNKRKERTSELAASGEEEGREVGQKKKKRINKRCQVSGCEKSTQGPTGRYIAHGGGNRCQESGCDKGAAGKSDRCKAHDGGRRCEEGGCTKSSRSGSDYCIANGAAKSS